MADAAAAASASSSAAAPAAPAAPTAAAAAKPEDLPKPVLKEGGDEVLADNLAAVSSSLFRKIVKYV